MSELSRDSPGYMAWHYPSLLFKKNKSTFLNYMPVVCIIGITCPPPSALQTSIVPALWLSSISYLDKLPVLTCPAWLCSHLPFTEGWESLPTNICRVKVNSGGRLQCLNDPRPQAPWARKGLVRRGLTLLPRIKNVATTQSLREKCLSQNNIL